ncbi:uncharacterized protein LOC119069924 [Bradysia coprophila]|uniref:uncharacterized protein LOC119069924 n=1 Tax=Bradysia coprophila TaxID=38358 RepID=UPI00187D9521|nr:uncharacterized protein LOC119069924 [Bradysia coprophila]
MVKLLKLPSTIIPSFMELYRAASYPRHALTYFSLKHFGIQSEKYPEFRENLELLTLNDNWKKDGLFLMKNGHTYYFDSLEDQPYNRVKELLMGIDYSKETVFRAVRDQFKPVMNDVLWLNNMEITDQTGTTMYFLDRDFLLKLPPQPIPEGWYFRSLTLNDVDEINQKVQREGGDNLRYIEHSIKYKLSLGLFDENNVMQSWVYGVDVGTLGTLGVTDEHKAKGAGSATSTTFAKVLLNQDTDFDIVWNCEHGNTAAHALAHRYKATNIGTVTWMAVNKRISTKMSQMGMYQIFYPKPKM